MANMGGASSAATTDLCRAIVLSVYGSGWAQLRTSHCDAPQRRYRTLPTYRASLIYERIHEARIILWADSGFAREAIFPMRGLQPDHITGMAKVRPTGGNPRFILTDHVPTVSTDGKRGRDHSAIRRCGQTTAKRNRWAGALAGNTADQGSKRVTGGPTAIPLGGGLKGFSQARPDSPAGPLRPPPTRWDRSRQRHLCSRLQSLSRSCPARARLGRLASP